MKKFLVTAAMAMSMGSVFAQGNATTNDTVKTDTTKALAAFMANDTVQSQNGKKEKETAPACDKKAGEKAIQALNAMRKITA